MRPVRPASSARGFSGRSSGLDQTAVSSPVVYVIEDARVVHVDESNAARVPVHDFLGLRIGRQLEEFRDQRRGEKHGVTAAAVESRNGYGGCRLSVVSCRL